MYLMHILWLGMCVHIFKDQLALPTSIAIPAIACATFLCCNHGRGLAIIHPTLYRHYLPEGAAKLAAMARNVWGVDEQDDLKAANAGIDALEAFIKEIGMPTRWREIGVTGEDVLRKSADAAVLTAGCCRRFTHDELYQVLKDTM